MKTQLLGLICFACLHSLAQQSSNIPTNVKANNLTQNISGGIKNDDLFFGIPLPPGKVVGDTYIDQNWRIGSIVLSQGDARLDGHELRFDIKNNEVEINSPYGIKVINGKRIKSFTLMDSASAKVRTFVNGKSFKDSERTPFSGFFEVLTAGKASLLVKTTLVVRKANYNVQLNVGNRDDQILKEERLFIAFGLDVIELPSSKKKIFRLFGEHESRVKDFVKTESLNVSIRQDLIRVVAFYNTLT